MPISEDKALEILSELIKKPESKAEDIPRIWSELMTAYNTTFAPTPEPVKKRRKRRQSLSPNLGWPQGVSRAEYKTWKEAQQAHGVTENLNPQEYKRLKDAGVAKVEEPAPAPKSESKPKPKPSGTAKGKKK